MILIDSGTRQFNIPGADLTFGVESDAGSERKRFQCSRYVGNNLDLASCFVRMNFRNANGDMDSYLVNDVTVDGDNVTFSWVLSRKVTRYKGQVKFVACAIGPDQRVEWHTTLGTGIVLEGLEPNIAVESETADVVAQLIAMVESQIAEVQAEGANQVAIVQNAAQTAQVASVAQIEAKGTTTLASIPEDYTALSNAVNGQANAVVGNLVGTAVRADDVSPLEHVMGVRVKSKNMIPPFPETKSSVRDGVTFSIEENGQTITLNGTCGSIGGGRNNFATITRRILLEKGKTYTLSHWLVSGTSDGIYSVYLTNVVDNVAYTSISSEIPSRKVVVTEDVECFIGVNAALGKTYDNLVVKFQLEEGTTATEYTPYVEPTDVRLFQYGRNMAKPLVGTLTVNGLTITPKSDGSIEITGAITGTEPSGILYLNPFDMNIPLYAGVDYTLRLYKDGVQYINPVGSRITYPSGTVGWNNLGTNDSDRTLNYVYLFHGSLPVGDTSLCGNYRLQIEVGEATEYEPYSFAEYTPDSTGLVSGVTSVSPTLTLTSDKTGVSIECEYNRDTNKVIADILEKIAALSGV